MPKTAAIAVLACLAATGFVTTGAGAQTSSEKVHDNPAAQYVLVKTVTGQSLGILKARALPVEAEGYNLLRYCWTPYNVLGEWGDRAGLTGEMVVRSLETLAWSRDLVRAGYPEKPTAEAIGRYEAALVEAKFANAARVRALDALRVELDGVRRQTPGAAVIHARYRCDQQATSLGLNFSTAPAGGDVRFIPYVLRQICQTQQLDADDTARCDYWLPARPDGPMSFAEETVYSVRWLDGTVGGGSFNPDEQRTTGTVTLRERPPQKK